MPNSGRYPCGNCNYVAASRRMLSRHTAIAHASQAFKCPLCPFVSCYQANLYRHKRDIHGLGRMTACEICGFFSSSIEDLIEHKENNHQDQIEWLKKKYANERVRLGVEAQEEADVSIDGEGVFVKKEDEATEGDCRLTENNENVEDVSLEDQNADDIHNRINNTTTTTRSNEMKSSQLGPIKIRRSYTCEECGLTTIDPREYLYHRRDDHGEKMTVHECKYCIYASRHVQKLQRHCALVHRQQMPVKKNASNSIAETIDSVKESSNATALKAADDDVESWKCVAAEELQLNNVTTESQPMARKVMPIKLFKCSDCPFQARDNLHLIEHEKDAHRKKKDYECVQCGYDTDNKSRFTRHIKYHDIPKLKCSFCDFRTPYKWNMDRHLRNHVENGEYECSKCSFKTHAKQSLTVHLDYHHGNASFNPKAKRPRLQTARKQRVVDHGQSNKLYSNNKALSDYIIDGEEENGDGDIDQIYDDNNDDTGSGDEDMVQRSLYLYQPSPEENMPKESYGSYKQHSCPLCDAKFNQLSSLGQHLKEGHPENDSASTIAAVVDMLSPQKHKVRESLTSTPLSGQAVTSKRSQFENKDKAIPTCKICGYKTRWASELLKHERVHSGEKPFECNICEYKCKWKGDLTRHLQKFHKKQEEIMPKISGAVEEDNLFVVPNDNQICPANGSGNEDFCGLKPASFNDQDSPLDLTVTKKQAELVLLPALLGSSNKSVNNYHIPKEKPRFIPKLNFPVKQQHSEYEIVEPSSKIIKKYKCTFCGFMTRTASRFHVHMVQHFDKRPFVCSACGYRSNWQWDITKHIKMKSARDDSHMNATLIITDQTGEKNYEKYKSYLVDVEESRAVKKMRISHRVENKQLQYDGEKNDDRDDSSYVDVTSVMDEPENIVVTPDLPFSFEDPNQSCPALPSANEEFVLEPHQSRPVLNNAVVNGPVFERYKLFHCKHCPYKHREKKVVVSHLAEHAGIKLFRCRVCGVSSNWKNVILRHVKTHHSGQLKYVEELITYTVEGHVVCLTGIKKQQNTDLMPIASPKKDATRRCNICPFTCLKENHFQFHMKQHQPREGTCFKCMFCPYYVKFRKTLIRHLELHKKESTVRNKPAQHAEEDNSDPAELFMKENCDNELPDNNNHSQQDTPNMPYDEQVNRDNFYLKEKRHSCEQCPYKTDNKTQYLYHKQFHRPNKSAKFKCKLCSYWATHHHLIAQHQRVHNTEQKPFSFVDAQSSRFVQSSQESVDSQCVEEQLDYDENRQIKQIYVKRGEFYFRMFKCNYCPMMNKRRANVRVHEKMHAKSKVSKYTCPLCNYKCNNQGIITAHMKIHGNNSTTFTSGYNNDVAAVGLGSTPVDTTQPPPLKRKRVFSYFCMRCPAVFKSTADLEIHKTFHTMSYPLPCPSCDYRAKNKACLHKHLLVHTPEYVAKREASYGPPVMATFPETSYVIKSSEANQMLLLEEAEMKAVIEGSAIHSPQRLHRCTLCPVAFFKATTLQYHLSLHGSSGIYSCSHCNYAVDRNENLISHEKLHISPPKLVKPKAPVMFFSCPKCPAFFDKMNRYNRHLRLHGQKNKYTCEHCDYSVRLPANLFNHKIVHTKSYAERKQDLSFVSQETSALGFSLSLESKNVEDLQKKKSFACDRCPYFYMRKDAVQRHQKRHSPEDGGEGLSCPYCDYSSLQLSFLRDHVRVHFQTESPYEAQAFMKHKEYEIWSVEDGKRDMLFKDIGVQKPNRFYPPLDKELEDLFAAEGEAPSEFSFVEHHERDDIPNRKVPFENPILFNETLEQLPVSQVHLELSSQQASSNSDEKSDLIEDALNQSKKLEVILTDVFYGGDKAVIMKAINNEAVVADQSDAQDILLEEVSFVPQEQMVPSPKIVQLDDVNPEIANESELATIEECSGMENITSNSIQLDAPSTDAVQLDTPSTDAVQLDTPSTDAIQLDTPSTDALQLETPTTDAPTSPTIDTNTDVIKHDMSVVDRDYKMSDSSSFMSKEEVFIGTNSSNGFSAIENEKTIVRSNSDYFNTEFFNEEKPNIPNDAVIEMQWKTEDTSLQNVVTEVAIDGCDNISDIQVNTTD